MSNGPRVSMRRNSSSSRLSCSEAGKTLWVCHHPSNYASSSFTQVAAANGNTNHGGFLNLSRPQRQHQRQPLVDPRTQ